MLGQTIADIFLTNLNQEPQSFKRCAVGIGNEVYIVECENEKYIFRCSTEENAYEETIHWLTKLSALDLPIPKVLDYGTYEEYSYLILNFIPGEDIGLVYTTLTVPEKKQIAKDVMEIQRKVARMQFGDKTIEVNDAVVDRLNRIYEELWEEYGKAI